MDGDVNVIVTDGFTGNIALKTAEGTANFISDELKKALSNNILGRITILPTDYTYIVDNASDLIFKERDYFGPVTIEKLQIKLLDHYGNEIDLNYNDYSFALEFTQIYS